MMQTHSRPGSKAAPAQAKRNRQDAPAPEGSLAAALNHNASVLMQRKLDGALNRGAWQRMKIGGHDVPSTDPAPDGVDGGIWSRWLADPQLEFYSRRDAIRFAKLAATVAASTDMVEQATAMSEALNTEGSFAYLEQAMEAANPEGDPLVRAGMPAHHGAAVGLIRSGYLRDVERQIPSYTGTKSFRRADIVARIGGERVNIESKNLNATASEPNSARQEREFRQQFVDYLAGVQMEGIQQQYRFAQGIPQWAYTIMVEELGSRPGVTSNLSSFVSGVRAPMTVRMTATPPSTAPQSASTQSVAPAPAPVTTTRTPSDQSSSRTLGPPPPQVSPFPSVLPRYAPPSFSAPSSSAFMTFGQSTMLPPPISSPRPASGLSLASSSMAPMPTGGSRRARELVRKARELESSTTSHAPSRAEEPPSSKRQRSTTRSDEPSNTIGPLLLPPPLLMPPPVSTVGGSQTTAPTVSMPLLTPAPPPLMPMLQSPPPPSTMSGGLSTAPPLLAPQPPEPPPQLSREVLVHSLAQLYRRGYSDGWLDRDDKREAAQIENELRERFPETADADIAEIRNS